MSKFKVGDKVVRKSCSLGDAEFLSKLGLDIYYVVTSVSDGGYWLQVDGVSVRDSRHPWYALNFELYQEPEDDGLPPVPESTLYISSEGRRELTVYRISGVVQLNVRLRDAYGYEAAMGYALDPDAALQLAHDIRRMAMDIKRKEKVQ